MAIISDKDIKRYKKYIRDGVMALCAQKDPGKSESTYKMYTSDSNYLLNNDAIDEYIRFVRTDEDMPDIQELIKDKLIEKRGIEKVTDGGAYYYEKLCWHREYVRSAGGFDEILKLAKKG